MTANYDAAQVALVRASIHRGGQYVSLFDIHHHAAGLEFGELALECASMVAYGQATAIGNGFGLKVRFNGLIWQDGDGTFGYILNRDRWAQPAITETLREGMVAVECSQK